MLAHSAGAKSILEVGSCYGMTLAMLGMFAGSGARIRSVDLGILPAEAGEYAGVDTSEGLNVHADYLRSNDIDVAIKYGNSHDPDVIQWAKDNGPYDFVFIDGDHTYHGVKADWEAYGPLGSVVAFHDIAHPDCGVKRLWNEIKLTEPYVAERVLSRMGIGIVRR